MEFPVLGEYHENLTLEEALAVYEKIPAERMNGIKELVLSYTMEVLMIMQSMS